MRTTRNHVWRVLLAACCALVPLSARAADPPPTSIKEVAVDLAGHTFAAPLPFDIPFFVTGTAPPRTRQIRVSIAETRKDGTVVQAGPRVALPWDAETVSETETPFRMLIPQLEAEKFYRFTFEIHRTLDKSEVQVFQGLAIPVLEQTLRALELQDGQLKPDDSSGLRTTLSTQLRQTLGKNQVIEAGTLFDLTQPHEEVLNQFNAAAAAVIAPQEDRTEALNTYAKLQADLRTALDGIRGEGALDRAAALLESSADATIVTALGQFRAGLDLARLEDAQAAARANGRAPLAPPNLSLNAVWTPTDVEPYAANYRRTQADLEALRQLLEATLPLLTSLADADRAAIQALLAGTGSIAQARSAVAQVVATVTRLRNNLTERTAALAALSTLVSIEGLKLVIVDGTSVAEFRTAQSWYISMDAGFMYAFRIGTMTPYVGANIYFRPVNKDAPFSIADSFGRRFALTFGITLTSIEEDSGDDTPLAAARKTRFDLINENRSLLLGVGFRVSQSLRLSGGALVLKERDPNPLISTISVATVPYLSFSLDFDVASTLTGGGLGALFGKSENK